MADTTPLDCEAAWIALRGFVQSEVNDYKRTNGKSKDARIVYAALEGAYSGVIRMMDRLEAR